MDEREETMFAQSNSFSNIVSSLLSMTGNWFLFCIWRWELYYRPEEPRRSAMRPNSKSFACYSFGRITTLLLGSSGREGILFFYEKRLFFMGRGLQYIIFIVVLWGLQGLERGVFLERQVQKSIHLLRQIDSLYHQYLEWYLQPCFHCL